MKGRHSLFVLLLAAVAFFAATVNTGCGVYSFADVSVPPEVKTVRVTTLDNKARYVNPQVGLQLTEKLRQKIVNQTRLTQTNSDNANWDVTGYISDYSVSTSAISSGQAGGTGANRQAAVTNRLTVGVHIIITDRTKDNKTTELDVSRSFDFDANLTLQAAEARLMDEIIRNMTDDIFNRMFSNW